MKTLTAIVFTTEGVRPLERELEAIRLMINNRIKNGHVAFIKVVKIDGKKLKPVITPSTKRIDWGWFKRTFSTEKYDIVAFNFGKRYKRKWKIKSSLNGSYSNDPDGILEFWFCADWGTLAKGYKKTTEVFRLFCHELLHGFFRKTGIDSNFVHTLDYQQKNVSVGFYLVDLDKLQ